MAEAPIPIKPGIFKCPDDFESMCAINDDTFLPSDNDDLELVLIRAPHGIDFSVLNDQVFPLNGSKEFEIGNSEIALNLNCKEITSNSELSTLSVLVGDNEKYVPVSKTFTHHVEISEMVNVPVITFPENSDKRHKMPSDLKQRYKAFGADDPVVSVGEKHMLKYKKKLKKELPSLDISNIKPSKKESKEKRKQFRDKMELTSKYIEQLSEIPPQKPKSLKKEKKQEVEELKLRSKKSKSFSSESDELRSPKNVDKKAKKGKTLPKNASKLPEEDLEIEHSRDELIKLIMGDKTSKKGKISKLKKETSMLTFSQEF